MKSSQISELKLLFADFATPATASKRLNFNDFGNVVCVDKATTAALLMETRHHDCAMVRFDPSSEASVDNLKAVCHTAKQHSVPVATIATFNPDWIQNLTAQFGAKTHFSDFPSASEITALVSEGRYLGTAK